MTIIIKFVCLSFVLCSTSSLESDPEVWLTISSLAKNGKRNGIKETVQRRIELNWKDVQFKEDNWIGLFNRPLDGVISTADALLAVNFEGNPEGKFITEYEFPIHRFTKENITDGCLGIWIAFVIEATVVTENCIKTNPFWMAEIEPMIEDKSMNEIMLPGTHNAGSYQVGYVAGTGARLNKYVICQDESIFNQLVYGIRYLDLRVSYENVRKKEEKLWIVHGILRVDNTLKDVLMQVKDFIEATQKEVIIIDFHRFEKGFDEDIEGKEIVQMRHEAVFKLIEEHLKDYLSFETMGYSVKYGDLIKQNKRIIVGYGGLKYMRNGFLYPRVRHLWASKDELQGLEEHFNRTVCSNNHPWEVTSAMAQLTPTTIGVLFDKYGGLRSMAQQVNSEINRWFRDYWWHCVQIVSTDFFLGNNLIELSKHSNIKRSRISI